MREHLLAQGLIRDDRGAPPGASRLPIALLVVSLLANAALIYALREAARDAAAATTCRQSHDLRDTRTKETQ